MDISVKNLSKTYKSHQRNPGLKGAIKSLFDRQFNYNDAVKEISFQIKSGEFVGFVGPNGAGKTTTLKMLSGILHPSSGSVQVLGFDPFLREHEFLSQISIVMGQKNQLTWELPAVEYFKLIKEMYQIPGKIFNKQLDYLADVLDVKELFKFQVRSLSLGERMKCELIAALLHKPKVLFLDEPTIGLDVISKRAIRDFLREINRKDNTTILLTSHYMDDIQQLCDRVIVIQKGTLIADEKVSGLISTQAPFKWLTLNMATYLHSDEIQRVLVTMEPFGMVQKTEPTILKIKVPTEKVKEACQVALSFEQVVDLSVKEPDLEEVMEQIFSGGQRRCEVG